MYDSLELSASLFSEVPQPIIYLVIILHPQIGAPEWQRQLYKIEREKRVGLCLFLPSRWVLMAGTFKWTQVEESHTLTLFLDFTHSPWVRADSVCRIKWLKVSFEGSQLSVLRWQAICPRWSLLLYSFAHLLVHLSTIYSFTSIHMCVYPPIYPCIHLFIHPYLLYYTCYPYYIPLIHSFINSFIHPSILTSIHLLYLFSYSYFLKFDLLSHSFTYPDPIIHSSFQ